eukprot:178339-Pyramimonas_sp.AAC.1
MEEARVYSHDGPIIWRRRGYILTTDPSDGGGAGIFSRRTHQMEEARVYSHDGPILSTGCVPQAPMPRTPRAPRGYPPRVSTDRCYRQS